MKLVAPLLLLTCIAVGCSTPHLLGQTNRGPSVLIVTAHPDDDALFAGSVYKITHELDGRVDLALITDGAGGYRFSTLGEPIYGLKLTDPEVAAEHLPAIRKQELMRGGKIVGMSNYHFLDQPDRGRSDDPEEFFGGVWDTSFVKNRLEDIMRRGDYDFVFAHLPVSFMHAHHKVATMLALEVASDLEDEVRPVVLGGWSRTHSDTTAFHFEQLEGYDITRVDPVPREFNRNQPIGLDGRLNYNIVHNWLVAEHKSQGTMQLFLSRDSKELYFYFLANGDRGRAAFDALFDRLSIPRPAPSASN